MFRDSDSKYQNTSNMYTISFYFSATGCADPKLSPGGFLQRAGDNAIIGCNGEEQKWRLKCVNGKWRGTYGNCTHGKADSRNVTEY